MGVTDLLRGLLNGAEPPGQGTAGERVAAVMAKAEAPQSLFEVCGADAAWVEAANTDYVDTDVPNPVQRRLERQQQLEADLDAADDNRRRAAVAYGYAAFAATGSLSLGWNSPLSTILRKVGRRRLPWTAQELAWLLGVVSKLKGSGLYYFLDLLTVPLNGAARLPDEEVAILEEPLRTIATAVRTSPTESAERTRALRRITEQLERVQPDALEGLPDDVLDDHDPFGPGTRTALLERFDPAVAGAALRLLGRYGTATTPNAKWQKEAAALVDGGQLLEVCELLLTLACGHREVEVEQRYGRHTFIALMFVSPATATVLRAAAWTALQRPSSERLALVADVAVHCGIGLGGSGGSSRCSQVTTTAVTGLSQVAASGPEHATEVVAHLARIGDRVQNKTIGKAVTKAIGAAAAAAGLTPGQLLERAVPTFGLDPDGTGQQPVGEHTALLALRAGPAGAKLELRWRTPTGREVAAVPASVKEHHADAVAELRSAANQAKKVAASQRQRLEDLLAVGRTWTGANWVTYYAEHPVVGLWARQLIWQARPATDPATATAAERAGEDGWASGLPFADADSGGWALTGHDGQAVPVGEQDEVRLWHPIRQPLADVRAWRAHLTEAGLRQPFKQAFREIYLLTPAEETTNTYSNRFAAHVVRASQFGALIRTRGWNAPHLGYWDGGWDATATKAIGEDGWRASFDYAVVENPEDGYETPSLAATDQVRLERWHGPRTGGGWRPEPLSQVPALVFSEAMRDVDLFVGVTSIAADPTWADRGTAGQRDYWHATSFGDLTESAQMRKDAIAALLPRTKLRDRARLEGNFLVVSGHLRDYKIHLGSTNILMSPADTYLCIVPSRADKDPGVFLPFEEGGGKLSVIWSKAFMLAEDNAITDPTITHQLTLGLEGASAY